MGPKSESGPLKLLFAESFGRRKGVQTLIAALERLRDVNCRREIAGDIGSSANRSYSLSGKSTRECAQSLTQRAPGKSDGK